MKRVLYGGVAAVAVVGGWFWLAGGGPDEKLDCATARAELEAIAGAALPGHKAVFGAVDCAPPRLSVAELRFLPQEAALDTPAITLHGLVLDAVDMPALKAALLPGPEAEPLPPDQALPILVRHVAVAEVSVQGGGSDIRLANLGISGVTARGFGPDADDGRVTVFAFETANADRIDVGHGGDAQEKTSYHAAAFAGFDGARFASVELSGWASTDPTGTSKISCDNVFYRGIAAGSLWLAFGYVPKDLQMLPKGFGEDPEQGLPVIAKAAIDLAQRIAVDVNGARNCSYAMDGPAGGISGRIGSWLIEAQHGFSIARASYDDITLALPPRAAGGDVSVAVKRIVIAGMHADDMLKAMAEGTAIMPDLSAFRLEQFQLDKFSVGVDGRPPATLERLAVSSTGYVDNIAGSGTATLAGLVFPAGILGEGKAREQFDLLGYDEIRLDANLAYTYDHQGKILDMKQIEIVQPGGGRLSLGFRFRDYDIKELYGALNSLRPPIALAGAKLEALNLVYEDQSLFGRVMAMLAGGRGTSVDDLVDEAREELANTSLTAPGPITKAAVMEVARFLEDPKRLALSLAPTRIATFAEIAGRGFDDIEGLARLLGLSLKAN